MNSIKSNLLDELKELSVEDLVNLYVEAKTHRWGIYDVLPKQLQAILQECLNETLLLANKSNYKRTAVERYRATEPMIIKRLYFKLGKRGRQVEWRINQRPDEDIWNTIESFGSVHNAEYEEALDAEKYLDECIYINRGDWAKILEDYEVQQLLQFYEVDGTTEEDSIETIEEKLLAYNPVVPSTKKPVELAEQKKVDETVPDTKSQGRKRRNVEAERKLIGDINADNPGSELKATDE